MRLVSFDSLMERFTRLYCCDEQLPNGTRRKKESIRPKKTDPQPQPPFAVFTTRDYLYAFDQFLQGCLQGNLFTFKRYKLADHDKDRSPSPMTFGIPSQEPQSQATMTCQQLTELTVLPKCYAKETYTLVVLKTFEIDLIEHGYTKNGRIIPENLANEVGIQKKISSWRDDDVVYHPSFMTGREEQKDESYHGMYLYGIVYDVLSCLDYV